MPMDWAYIRNRADFELPAAARPQSAGTGFRGVCALVWTADQIARDGSCAWEVSRNEVGESSSLRARWGIGGTLPEMSLVRASGRLFLCAAHGEWLERVEHIGALELPTDDDQRPMARIYLLRRAVPNVGLSRIQFARGEKTLLWTAPEAGGVELDGEVDSPGEAESEGGASVVLPLGDESLRGVLKVFVAPRVDGHWLQCLPESVRIESNDASAWHLPEDAGPCEQDVAFRVPLGSLPRGTSRIEVRLGQGAGRDARILDRVGLIVRTSTSIPLSELTRSLRFIDHRLPVLDGPAHPCSFWIWNPYPWPLKLVGGDRYGWRAKLFPLDQADDRFEGIRGRSVSIAPFGIGQLRLFVKVRTPGGGLSVESPTVTFRAGPMEEVVGLTIDVTESPGVSIHELPVAGNG